MNSVSENLQNSFANLEILFCFETLARAIHIWALCSSFPRWWMPSAAPSVLPNPTGPLWSDASSANNCALCSAGNPTGRTSLFPRSNICSDLRSDLRIADYRWFWSVGRTESGWASGWKGRRNGPERRSEISGDRPRRSKTEKHEGWDDRSNQQINR